MLIDHHFDITDLLNKGAINTIAIRIDPAVAAGQKNINGVIGTRMDFGAEAVHVRKAPHMYGWDIMPRLISAGLWRSVHLEVIKPTRLNQVYWMTNSVDLLKRRLNCYLIGISYQAFQLSIDLPWKLYSVRIPKFVMKIRILCLQKEQLNNQK